MAAGLAIRQEVRDKVDRAVTGSHQCISVNSAELKQVIQLCNDGAPKCRVVEALSLFRKGSREAVRSFLKSAIPECWHELIDTYPIGEVLVVSEVKELVNDAMSMEPMSRFEICRRDLQEVIQRCFNGDSVESVERSFTSLKRAGECPEPVASFLLQQTQERYHEIFH